MICRIQSGFFEGGTQFGYPYIPVRPLDVVASAISNGSPELDDKCAKIRVKLPFSKVIDKLHFVISAYYPKERFNVSQLGISRHCTDHALKHGATGIKEKVIKRCNL